MLRTIKKEALSFAI